MELLVVLAWVAFLVYIAKTREGTMQLHLVIVWGLLFLSAVIALAKLIWSELQ